MEYAPDIEEYSIDESFLFFDDCNWSIKDYEEIGFDLKRRIAKEAGIPICVGAAPSHLLHAGYSKCRPSCPTLYLPLRLRLQGCNDYAA